MKNWKQKLKGIIIIAIIFSSSIPPVLEFAKSLEKKNNENLLKSSSIIETSLILLDNPGKMLCWNKTGTIAAKLVTKEDNKPIPLQYLELHVFIDNEWKLYSEGLTNEIGVINFTFFVELDNGDHPYRVNFEGYSVFTSVKVESYFTVISDYIKPYISFNMHSCNDAGIVFDYTIGIDLWPVVVGGLDYAYIELLARKPNTYSILVYSKVFTWDGMHGEYNSGLITWTSAASGSLGLGYLLHNGWTTIDVYIEAEAGMLLPVIWPPFIWYFEEQTTYSQSFTLVDDDDKAPIFIDNSHDPSISIQYQGDYNINLTYKDKSGWDAYIQYSYVNETCNVIYDDYIGGTDNTDQTTITYSIPRANWSLFPGTTIRYRTKAIDRDLDRGGGKKDSSASNWTNWIDAGHIFKNVGGALEKVETWIYLDDIWQIWPISPSRPSPYNNLYLRDINFFTLSIVNPLNDEITVFNALLSFSCPKFLSGSAPSPLGFIISDPLQKQERLILENNQPFNPSHFVMDGWTATNITIEFAFNYYIGNSNDIIFHFSQWYIFTIIKPPQPTVSFTGFTGPRYYKWAGKGSEIYANFVITNNARIPIKVTQNYQFSNAVGEELREKLTIKEQFKADIFIIPSQSSELSFKMNVPLGGTSYFIDANFLFKFLKFVLKFIGTSLDASLIAAIKSIEELSKTGLKNLALASGIINVLLASYNIALTIIAGVSRLSDIQRNYEFMSNVTWKYIHNRGYDDSDHNIIGYSNIEPSITTLTLVPSPEQDVFFYAGLGIKIGLGISYGIAAAIHFSAYAAGPLSGAVKAAAVIMSLVCLALEFLSDFFWSVANDDIPLNDNHDEIYVPEYSSLNISDYEATNEFEETILNLGNTTLRMTEDLKALNETKSRKESAIIAGDFDAALTQNMALMDYSGRVANDFKDLNNDLELLGYHMKENTTKIKESIYELESNFSQSGLSEEEILLLQSNGFNQTEIQSLNETLVNVTTSNLLSNNITSLALDFETTLNTSSQLINAEIKSLEDYSLEIINESIQIKTEVLNESIISVDNETLQQLDQLKDDINLLFLNGDWINVVEKSDLLIQKAREVVLETNNNSYFIYVEFANEYKANAELYLRLNLYHLKDISITDNETKTLNVIAHSHGAPTADYILETNCSWVTPTQQIVPIEQYNKTVVKLIISTKDNPLILLGTYHVNLKLYLPQTKTIINSVLTLHVKDDDTSIPNIQIIYTGDETDGHPGSWDVNITDSESGLDNIQIYLDGIKTIEESLSGKLTRIYTIPIQNTLGNHQIKVIALNFDRDWNGDQESASITDSIFIKDDDTIEPEIKINYVGDGTDGYPGYFEWEIGDIDDGIGGDNDSGFSNIEIIVLFVSTEGLPNQEYTLTPTEIGIWALPPFLGAYTMIISATDNDDDRTLNLDSLTIELGRDQEIIDDDVDPPELSDLKIEAGIFEINISFIVMDDSGIKAITILINGEAIEPIKQIQDGDNYLFTVSNHWLFEKEYSEVEVIVEDNDYDRPNDSLISSISGSFQNNLYQMYEYVNWQLEKIKDYINENLHYCKARNLIWKLTKAQEYLTEAFELIEKGDINCGLYHDKMAKLMVYLTEIKIECHHHHKCCQISSEESEFIIATLQEIRNNIVILMGASTGNEKANEIAYLEVELLNLYDYINDEMDGCSSRCLGMKLWVVSCCLEVAIIKISKGEDVDCLLKCVKWKLEHINCKIDWMLKKGKISEDLALYSKSEISQIVESIDLLLNI